MDFFQAVFIPAAIIAVVKFYELVEAKNYKGAAKIVVAVIVGGVAGYFGFEQLTLVTGIYAGLVASGTITAVQKVGK